MHAEDQGPEGEKRRRRKRKMKTVGCIFGLVCASVVAPVFVTAVWVGYLSRIGILVGVVFLMSGILSPLLGLAGRKRLERFLSLPSIVVPILLILGTGIAAIWPVDNSVPWEPYRFDKDFDLLEAERTVSEHENAAIRCAALFAGLDTSDQPSFFFNTGRENDVLYEDAWTRSEHPEASQWVDAYTWAVDELVRADATGTFRWPLQRATHDEPTVPRTLGRGLQLLILSANRDLGEGQLKEAIAKYFATIGIANDLRQQMQPLDFTVSDSYETRVLRLIRRALVQYPLSHGDIAQITKRLPTTDDQWPVEGAALLRAERLRYMNLLAQLYEVNPEGGVRFSSHIRFFSGDTPVDVRWLRPYWLLSMPLDPKGLHGIADDYFGGLHYLLESGSVSSQSQSRWLSWSGAWKALVNPHRWLAEMTFYADEEYIWTRQLHASLVAERRGTWLVLGLRRYRDEHDSWPSSLDEISEYVPAEAFVDPINGGRFVYTRTPDDFRVYSTGLNQISDVESSPPDTVHDDIVIWPLRQPKPPRTKSTDAIMKELKAIYGDRYITRHQADVNAP